ncbi:MAG: PaaI family thioesterase [Alphaproteobacteria bacterium]|nr:PaaI family thioesterase [Alphaproteobacteria bacterium]
MAEPPENIPPGFEPVPGNSNFIHHAGPVYWGEAEDQFVLGFRVLEHHANPARMAAGGMLMTVMDLGLIMGIISAQPDGVFSPTTSLSVDFIAGAQVGDWVESRVDFVHLTKRRGYVSGRLMGPRGVILRANGTFSFPSASDARFNVGGRASLRDAVAARQKLKKAQS